MSQTRNPSDKRSFHVGKRKLLDCNSLCDTTPREHRGGLAVVGRRGIELPDLPCGEIVDNGRMKKHVAWWTVALVLPCARAWAIQECTLDAKPVNLNHGGVVATLDGVVECKDSRTGKVVRRIPYKKGKIHGVEVMESFDGKRLEISYREGKRHGLTKTFDPKGNLEKEESWLEERELGPARHFHPNGRVRMLVERAREDIQTLRQRFDADGHLAEVTCGSQIEIPIGKAPCKWGDKSETVKTFFPDGKLREEIALKRGLREGLTKVYFQNGKVAREEPYVAGKLQGTVKMFDDAGRMREQTVFGAGEKDGAEEKFFEDRTLESRVVWKAGQKALEEKRYRNGQPKSRVTWNADAVIEEEFWDNGRPRSLETFKRSGSSYRGQVRHGPSKEWYESGTLRREASYQDGKLEGTESVFHESGKLSARSEYKQGRRTTAEEYDEAGKQTKREEYYEDGSRK